MTVKSGMDIDFGKNDVDRLLSVISQHYGYDFSNYSRPSIERRLTRFIINSNLKSLDDLEKQLLAHTRLFEVFLEEMMVGVTAMFRDPAFFKALRQIVCPILSTYPHIRVWMAGCSTGEELLSLSIMFAEEDLLKRTKIYATDINQKSLLQAKNGVVPLSEIDLYAQNYLEAGGTSSLSGFYSKSRDMAVFDPELLKNIAFYPHNLVADSSFNEFHMIICRNVLIYFNRTLQEHVIKLFQDSLAPLGYLGLGNKETIALSQYAKNFETIDKHNKIFRKIRI